MRLRSLARAASAVVVGTGLILAARATTTAGRSLLPTSGASSLAAAPLQPLLDTDGDGLPDLIEFVGDSSSKLSDTDGDGRSDLVEFLDYTSPNIKDAPKKPQPDGFRVLLNTTEEGANNQHVLWMHLLFRFRSGTMTDLKGLGLFIDLGGNRYSLDPLLSIGVADFVEMRHHVQGLLVRVTLKIPMFQGFSQFTPVTFGGYALIGNVVLASGSMLFHQGGAYFTIVPAAGKVVFQATSATARNPFWASHKRCVFQLEVQGVGRSGQILEVKKASCETSNARRCTASCPKMRGQTFFVPDGLPLILGG